MTTFEIIKKIFQQFIITTGKSKFILVVIFWFLVSFLYIIEPLFFTQIIKAIENYLKTWIFDTNEIIKLLIYWLIFIVISILSSMIYRYYFVIKNLNKNIVNTTTKYADIIINMSYQNYLSKEIWSIYKIFDKWIDFQFQFLFFFFLELIKWWWWIILVIIILFYIDVKLALVTLSLLPIMILLWIYFYKKHWTNQKKLNDKWDSIYWDFWNIMSIFWLVKILSIEKKFLNKISDKLDYCLTKQNKLSKWWTIADLYTNSLITITRFLVLWFWIYFVINKKTDFATLFLFFSYIWWIYHPIWSLFWRLYNIQTWLESIWKFYREFDNLESEEFNNNWLKLTNIKWNIEFKNVTFSYTSQEVINNLSFSINSWEKVAIVWDTWAWKTTIINLILKFWKINSGKILIDDYDINEINLKSFRQHIWVVSQDNSLFNLSIKENLLFAKQNATQEELESALKKSESNFVFDLKNWINTVIWERWLKLSWWEKQRLSIARLFLKNPKILILDEATSALDNKTEKLIHKALENLMKWRTTIIIAHRLSTIKNVDRILVIKKWKIVEEWNYEELMNKQQEFYKLVNPDSLLIN